MKRALAQLLYRHSPHQRGGFALMSGLAAALVIAALAWVSGHSAYLLLMPPFGASAVLVFNQPQANFAQPINVVGSHLLTTFIGLCGQWVAHHGWLDPALAMGLGVGLSISLMAVLRITHPPAGANPILVGVLHPSWWFVVSPVLLGSLALVAAAYGFHRAHGHPYPKPLME